jgi:hypothetical protein
MDEGRNNSFTQYFTPSSGALSKHSSWLRYVSVLTDSREIVASKPALYSGGQKFISLCGHSIVSEGNGQSLQANHCICCPALHDLSGSESTVE